MIKFLPFILLLTFSAHAECEKNPGKDYAGLYETDSNEVLLTFDQDLGKGLKLLLVAAKSSCGARSCEYAGYVKDAQGCFQRVMAFIGSFAAGKEGVLGLKSIIVTTPGEKNEKRSCEWQYRPVPPQMFEVTSTCKATK